MGGQGQDLIIKNGDNEMNSFLGNALNALLDDMIPILITHATHHMTIKLSNQFDLLVHIDNFYSLYSKENVSNQ